MSSPGDGQGLQALAAAKVQRRSAVLADRHGAVFTISKVTARR